MNLLKNPGFAGGWTRETHTGQEYGEIFVPEGWVAYWKEGRPVPHDPGNPIGYGRPEMHIINKEPPFVDPPRIHSGTRAFKLFTFYRIHQAGLYQTVNGVQPGQKLRASGWAHAWSSNGDNAHYSDGAGETAIAVKVSDYDKADSVRNFTFEVGIDPNGGKNPWSNDVVWGEGTHIYNAYAEISPVEVVSEATSVTLFVRSSVLWPFKHCDAYLDTMSLEVIAESTPVGVSLPISMAVEPPHVEQGAEFVVSASGGQGPRSLRLRMDHDKLFTQGRRIVGEEAFWTCLFLASGELPLTIVVDDENTESLTINVSAPDPVPELPVPPVEPGFSAPREDYDRTYLLLPPDAGDAWLQAVVESGVWHRNRWTIGGSADDAGIGPTQRRVVAVNAHKWPGSLREFFEQYYAGVDYIQVTASTPADLRRILATM